MALRVKVLATKPDNPSLSPMTNMVGRREDFNRFPPNSMLVQWPVRTYMPAGAHAHAHRDR